MQTFESSVGTMHSTGLRSLYGNYYRNANVTYSYNEESYEAADTAMSIIVIVVFMVHMVVAAVICSMLEQHGRTDTRDGQTVTTADDRKGSDEAEEEDQRVPKVIIRLIRSPSSFVAVAEDSDKKLSLR